jgi:ornithine cyclodeaminase
MIFVSEAVSKTLVSRQLARSAVRDAMIAAASDAISFQPVLGHGARPDHRFSIKAASLPDGLLTGLKVGSYWPSNAAHGRPRHNSTVAFIDEETGRVAAIVEAGEVNAYRTAAADALAAGCLARADASMLALFGAGHQAFHEALALNDVRPLRHVAIVNRSVSAAEVLAARLRQEGIAAHVDSAEPACRAADIIVTVTASRSPLFDAAWVRPGTHVASMGSDGPGKQELPPELLKYARLVADLPAQSIRFGEFQHLAGPQEAALTRIDALGHLLAGHLPSRLGHDDITVFDSSGLALQDLFIAHAILDLAVEQGLAVKTDQEPFELRKDLP